MINYYKSALQKYAVFSGRARRMEFWSFAVVNSIIAIGLIGLAWLTQGGFTGIFQVIYYIYTLAILIPGIALSVRRLHDTNRSGWWLLLSLIPLIGLIVLIVFYFQDGTPGTNTYGDNPKGASTATVTNS